jgi:hypothetical protein
VSPLRRNPLKRRPLLSELRPVDGAQRRAPDRRAHRPLGSLPRRPRAPGPLGACAGATAAHAPATAAYAGDTAGRAGG